MEVMSCGTIVLPGGIAPASSGVRATIPAPALPGSGSDGRRPGAALSARVRGLPFQDHGTRVAPSDGRAARLIG